MTLSKTIGSALHPPFVCFLFHGNKITCEYLFSYFPKVYLQIVCYLYFRSFVFYRQNIEVICNVEPVLQPYVNLLYNFCQFGHLFFISLYEFLHHSVSRSHCIQNLCLFVLENIEISKSYHSFREFSEL